LNNRTESVEQFVDREDVFRQLEEAMTQVNLTGVGKAVLITGEPGIGKSTLVNEFLKRFEEEDATILHTSGLAFGTGPYTAMGGIFEPLLESKTITQQGKQVTQVLLNLARLVPVVGNYADTAGSVLEGVGNLSHHDMQSISAPLYVKTLLVSLLEKLSKKRPLVAFLDDVQWFDEFSLEAVGFLMLNISRIHALILISSRTGYAMSEREGRNLSTVEEIANGMAEHAIQLHLEPLDPGPSGELVKRILGGSAVDQQTLLSLVGRFGGNPLLITKTVRELVDQRIVASSEDGWRLNGDPSKVVPASISSLVKKVLLRIQREDRTGRTVLDCAAILGKQFSVAPVAELVGLDLLGTKHVLEELESAYGLIHATESPAEYSFDHDLTREVVLSSLGELAKPYHLKVAKFYDTSGRTKTAPQLAAYHYEEAGEYQKAFDLYRAASRDMESRLAFVGEAGYLRKCLDLSAKRGVTLGKKPRSVLLVESAQALFSSGKFNEALSDALESIKGGLPKARRAEAHLLAGRSCRYLGTSEAGSMGMKHLKMAVTLFNQMNDQVKVGEAYSSLSTLADHFADPATSIEAFGRSQKAFNLARDATGLAILQRKSGMIYDSRRAIQFMENAIHVFKKTDSMIELARCYNNLGGEHFYIGDFDLAKDKLLQALELYRRFEFYEVDAALNNLGLVQMHTGEMSHARESLAEAERRASEDFIRICVGSNLSTLERLTGSPETAFEKLSRLVPLVSKSGEPMIQDYFAFNMAVSLFDSRQYEKALEWLEKYPPNKWKGDDALILAKRQMAQSKILAKLGRIPEAEEAREQATRGFRTNRPQKWYYELDYYPCDIHILD